ncbi:hypothetical protein [Paraburkholderia sp. J67]|uniref:hypothetical protein n=1 Tax=Paraburkholderia sp. J67 TaxID=2805435 RepID=UPI002ABD59AC|nr:hypothetical protein [Paraburkholderia sp. J67]
MILYVQDVDRLKRIYQAHFSFLLVEEIGGEWALLKAGAIEIALHRAGQACKHSASACTTLARTTHHLPGARRPALPCRPASGEPRLN